MAHTFDSKNLLGGLNSDDEVRNIPQGDYLFAKNIRNAITAANKGGTLTNILGNLKITKVTSPYNGGTGLPAGRNKCIGAVEDTNYGGCIFMVWNSQGKHGIYRYYRNQVDPANPYGAVEQIIQYDFGWTRNLRITSMNLVYGDPTNAENIGDLLYWCDPKPRKINITKGNIVGKLKSWNVYLPITSNLPAIPVITFRDFSGAIIYQAGLNLTNPTDREATISEIATFINASSAYPVTAIACDCKLQFVEKVAGTVWTIAFDTNQIMISPDNWYGDILIEQFFDRCKYPALQAPHPTFEIDTTYEPNYVQKKVFQFRLEYLYDDREESVLGVWSQIPINNLSCDGTSALEYNYIDVNFNDTTVIDKTVLVLLKKIRFIARELNTGADRSIIDLEPCDFLDFANGNFYAHYNFYNDIISSAIDPATAAKIFDDVPLESAAEIMKDNRMIEANCLTGYNPLPCIDAHPQMEFGGQPNPKLYRVKFKVRILTYGLSDGEQADGADNGFVGLFPNLKKYPFWQPGNPNPDTGYTLVRGGIFHDTLRTENNFAFWGGGGFGAGAGADFGIRSGIEDFWDQRIPDGGFTIYMAGTSYFGITKQISIGLPTDENGALDTSTAERRIDIGNYLYNGGDLYSEVELLLPAGKYVARMASPWCSFNDKLALGFPYNLSAGNSFQKTSANVWGIYTDGLNNWNKEKEWTFEVTNADIDEVCTFVVADLAPPWDVDNDGVWRSYNCYLYDDSNGTSANSDPNSSTFEGIPVEKTLVRYQALGAGGALSWQNIALTDHNGYWFAIGNQGNEFVAGQINGITAAATTVMYTGSLGQFYDKTLVAIPMGINDSNPNLGLRYGVIATDNAATRTTCSTVITGTIQDSNGMPISSVSAIYQNGRVAFSNSAGTYSLVAWGDMITPNLPNFPTSPANPITAGTNRIVDNIIFNLSIYCQPSYPNGQELTPVTVTPININGTTTPPPYSPTAWYDAGVFIINEANNPSVKAHKRGGNYTYALRAYDEAGRCCTVVSAFEMYVPFITEDIGKYGIQDFSGNIYPAGTFLYGKPTIKWVLAANTTFPSWVKTIQWMRVKNSIYGRYLQWVANQVTYLSAVATASTPEIQTSFQNADAVAIKISISNITSYYAANNDSQIGYEYQAGDRVRLIADRTLINYTGVNDFPITSYDNTTQSIIIKPEGFTEEIQSGTLLEIFNPKSVATTDEQIFYEVGEVVNVTNGVPDSFSGVFTNGDTYWHGRLIIVNDEATKFASAYPVVIESSSISDFYISEAQDIGRIGIIDNNFRQVRRPMLLKASNQFIPATAINGLSAFEALNETELDRANGSIQRLVSINQTVVAISNVRETSTYIQVVTFQQANQGNGVIAIANQYFGTQYPHSKTLGTDLPASVFINDGIIFGYHSGRSDVFMYQGDGETPISDIKMKNYFQELANSGVSDAVAVYDRFHEEYWLTIWRNKEIRTTINTIATPAKDIKYVGIIYADGADLPVIGETITFQYLLNGVWATVSGVCDAISPYSEGGNVVYFQLETEADLQTGTTVNIIYSKPETICWFNGNDSIQKRRWVSQFDFTPEQYCQIASEVVMFKDGELWISDKNPTRNNFFGVQYKTEITPVFNAQPQLLKVWNANILKTFQANWQNDWSAPIITNDNGQQSRLVKGSWVKKGEDWFAAFKRDLNDITVTNPIVNGRALRSSTLVCQLQNDTTGELTLYGWFANFTLSERTQPK